MVTAKHHSHRRPTCESCGDQRGPHRPTGRYCEHGVQTFYCLPCAEAASEATARESAERFARWHGRLAGVFVPVSALRGESCVGCGADDDLLPVGHGSLGQLFACPQCDQLVAAEDTRTPAADLDRRVDMIRHRARGVIARSGLRLSDVADGCGLTDDELEDRLDGRAVLTALDLLGLAVTLDCSAAEFFGEDGR
ncbi:hypothetical protein IU487_22650 [Nocardia puris]|uniref:hypothetical protein n=1 Tax=Nocardia puris TaxID=208602 RepID=UPI0018951AC0|nr:hypothetical protein [Nocardia puris]MBF6213820.1 hypothetical protein [Nocardia puris]